MMSESSDGGEVENDGGRTTADAIEFLSDSIGLSNVMLC